MHSLDLLLASCPRIVEGLVLLLDAGDLTFDLLLPVVVMILLTLLVFRLEFTDFLELSFFFNFQ